MYAVLSNVIVRMLTLLVKMTAIQPMDNFDMMNNNVDDGEQQPSQIIDKNLFLGNNYGYDEVGRMHNFILNDNDDQNRSTNSVEFDSGGDPFETKYCDPVRIESRPLKTTHLTEYGLAMEIVSLGASDKDDLGYH